MLASLDPRSSNSWRPLTGVAEGSIAYLRERRVAAADQAMLTALGLVPDHRLLVCKAGAPFIVEVRGVRIGLSRPIAAQLMVEIAGSAGETS